MATDVVMPQMGESIAEGTIVRWIKKVGDRVERDEPLFEISTDKVDAEIPSPVAGVMAEIRAKEGETVPVNSVVAVISSDRSDAQSAAAATSKPSSEQPAAAAPERAEGDAPRAAAPRPGAPAAAVPSGPVAAAPPKSRPEPTESRGAAAATPPAPKMPAPAPSPSTEAARPHPPQGTPAAGSVEELIRRRSSPLVRKIA